MPQTRYIRYVAWFISIVLAGASLGWALAAVGFLRLEGIL